MPWTWDRDVYPYDPHDDEPVVELKDDDNIVWMEPPTENEDDDDDWGETITTENWVEDDRSWNQDDDFDDDVPDEPYESVDSPDYSHYLY